MRRLILEDPYSRSAIWSRNLAVFAQLVAAIGVLLARKGLDATASVAIVAAALGIATLSVLAAIFALGVIWQKGYRGFGLALAGLALSGLLFAYPAYVAMQARAAPPTPDIASNVDDPPSFLATEKARAVRHGLVPGPMRASSKDVENRLYPDFDTLTLDADADDVFQMVRKLVVRRHWQVADTREPDGTAAGQIDAVAKTLVMGFPADVAIRIRQAGDQTQVDVRSVARTAWQEPGSNAARVQTLLNDIEAAADKG